MNLDSNNLVLAQEHAIKNSDLVDLIVGEIDGIFESGDTLKTNTTIRNMNNNGTLQALVLAEIIDAVSESYGNAYKVGFGMTNMTNMTNMVMMGGNSSSMAMGGMSDGDNNNSIMNMSSMNMSSLTMMNTDSKTNKNYSLTDMADYQSAQALAAKALQIFNTELRPIVPKNESGFISKLEEGLAQLKDSIRNKASPMDIMMVVHTQIHPNLLEAFNLQLRETIDLNNLILVYLKHLQSNIRAI